MKIVTLILIAAIVFALTMSSPARALFATDAGVKNASPAVTLIASKKKSRESGGQSSVDPYVRAMELCRRKYGHSHVVRIRINSDGSVTCYVNFYSPSDGKTNFNKKR